MIKNYKKNLKILKNNHVYSKNMEHDACGVGLVASTEGKKLRKIVEYGIEALKAVWHRGAVDADGKTGVKGREKNIYSIYRKIKSKHKPFSEILDVYGFRILVDSIDECYRSLGIIHNYFSQMGTGIKTR